MPSPPLASRPQRSPAGLPLGLALGFAVAWSTEARALGPPPSDQHFSIDPVADGVFIAAGAGLSGLNELILSTGEIAPQRPGSTGKLLPFDRIAVTQTFDSTAGPISDAGLGLALAFAVLDPFLSRARDGSDAAIVDAVIYAESLSLTLALTDFTKIAVRRPRPVAYIEQEKLDAAYGGADKSPSISSTDATLSFFSGHAAIVAATTATATYLAFVRSPHSWRPWVTLALGSLLTTFVAYERVRSGAHFPTDVVGGALTGGAIGVLVPHTHRHDANGPSVWIGFAPAAGVGGTLTLQGRF
ncbi:MAG: phosphatase PAP2 family protein [Myxococcota bacterium]|nr:phosphatase PAP2 family protein [Myxococcota bacterium]